MKPFLNAFLSRTLYCYIRLVFATQRWEYENAHWISEFFATGKPFILTFWHGRTTIMPCLAPQPERIYVTVSRHSDGALMGRIMRLFRLKLIHGSTNRMKSKEKGFKNRGGTSTIRETFGILKRGGIVAFAPDGPKGPACKVNGAVVDIATKAQVPILPLSFSTSRAVVFNSWDRFLLPLPFGRGAVVCGDLIMPKSADKAALEDALNRATDRADQLVGRTHG